MVGLLTGALLGVVFGAAAGEVLRAKRPDVTSGIEAKTASKMRAVGSGFRRARRLVAQGFEEALAPEEECPSGRPATEKAEDPA